MRPLEFRKFYLILSIGFFVVVAACSADTDIMTFSDSVPLEVPTEGDDSDTEETPTEEETPKEDENPSDDDTPPDDEMPPDDETPPDNDDDIPAADPASLVRINSGGGEVSFGDIVFLADDYFSGDGSTFTNSNVTDISGTQMDEIYFSERSADSDLGSFRYTIPISNGTYQLDLHFAETWFGAPNSGPDGPGNRVFDVFIEGESLLMNFDINNEVGTTTATVQTFTVDVQDERMDIVFTSSVNRPKLSAFEIIGNGELLEDVCAFNPLANSALEKLEAQSAEVNGRIYVFAGFLADLIITDATEIYDPSTDRWLSGAPMPLAVTHMGTAVIGDEVWIVGGFAGDHPGVATDRVQIYNTFTNSWQEGPALPNPRGSGAAVYNMGKLHFFGGLLPDRNTDVSEHIVLDLSDVAAGWQTAPDLPVARNHHSGASVNGKVYAIGGQTGHDGAVNDMDLLHVYDPTTNQWTQLTNLPSRRSHFEPGTIVHNDKIIIVGGRRGNFFFENITTYDPVSNTWSENCPLPNKLLAPVAKVFGNQLIISNGGIDGINEPQNGTMWIPIQ